MIYTQEEKGYLKSNGFDYVNSNEYQREMFSGTVTVEKEAHNVFHYYIDVDGDDLNKANNNKTILDLTWVELTYLIRDLDYA